MLTLFHAFWLRPQLLAAIAAGLAVAALAPGDTAGMRLLAGWCAGVAVYAGLVVHQLAGRSSDTLRRQASRLDDSAAIVTLLAVLASAASLGSVAVLIAGGRAAGPGQAYALTLAGAGMLCTWALVQLVFTEHYAHVFYGGEDEGDAAERGGLDFHGDSEPDFWDFLYFTVTIGAAVATSDTNITSKRMRRIATAQTVCAYLFNTGVLALAVNMAAGFVPH